MSNKVSDGSLSVGSMPASLVASLAGVTLQQLRLWRRSSTVSASALPPRRGKPCAYRWSEYQRARLAALLVRHGLRRQNLRRVLEEYCAVIAPGEQVSTTVTEQRAIVQHDVGVARTAEHLPQGAWFDFVLEARFGQMPLANRLELLPDGTQPMDLFRAFHTEGPLGALNDFADVVDIRPQVMGGSPTIKGRRLETAALSSLYHAGDEISEIADAYDLPHAIVERAIAFEQALEQHALATG